jgi:hypothetical protein
MGYVKGYAFADSDVKVAHELAWHRVQQMNLAGAVLSRQSLYGRNEYRIDSVKTAGLSDLEKVVLVDGGPSPFGGNVSGSTVTVYTD